MELKSPRALRARIKALRQTAQEVKPTTARGRYHKGAYELVSYYGYVPQEVQAAYNGFYRLLSPHQSDSPLTTAEWLTGSTWFARYPEKMAGPEVLTRSSSVFPVSIEASPDQVQQFLADAIARLRPTPSSSVHPDQEQLRMKTKLAGARAKALLLLQDGDESLSGFAGFAGLPGLSGLHGLGELVSQQIANSSTAVEAVLKKAEKEKKQPVGGILEFEEVLKLYNQGISGDEMRAWVWYKRSLGHPMKGWEKFYLAGSSGGGELAYAVRNTVIKDNHFRDLETVVAGACLGRPTKFNLDYSATNYRIVTLPSGAKAYVKADDLVVKKNAATADPDALDKLVRAGALFVGTQGELLPLPAFTFGNMYDRQLEFDKQRADIEAKYGKEVTDRHAEVIAAARPRVLSITDPNPRYRPTIAAISDFARHRSLFTIRQVAAGYDDVADATETAYVNGEKKERTRSKRKWDLKLDGETDYSLVSVFAKWLYTLTTRDFEKPTDAANIVQFYLEGGNIVNDELTPEEKKQLKYEAREEAERLFARFLYEVLTPEDQHRLDLTWNRIYNGEAEVRYDKVPVAFKCSATFKNAALQITPTQRQGVAFFDLVGSGINCFDVGVGKTMTTIVSMANGLSSGRMQRPLVVVPNAVYDKWIEEIFGRTDAKGNVIRYGVLTGAGYTLNAWGNLGSDSPVAAAVAAREAGKKNTILDKPVAAGSITIVTYEGFVKLGFSPAIEDDMIGELAAVLQQSRDRESASTLRAEAEKKKKGKSARDEEKASQSLREMIGSALVNTVADYDTLGFDALVIDEAHNFNKVFESVPSDDEENKRYYLQSRASQRGVRGFLACNYIQRTYHGNVYLLTATPFTNSPLEVYSMLSLVAWASMRRMGVLGLREFCDTFVLPTADYSVTPEGTLTVKEAVKSFVNRVVLQRLLHNHCILRSGEEAGVPRPCKVNLPRLAVREDDGTTRRLPPAEQITTYLTPSPLQGAGQYGIVAAIQEARNTMGKNLKAGKGEMFSALNDSLNNALTPFLYFGSSLLDELRGDKPLDMKVKMLLMATNQKEDELLKACKGMTNQELLLKFSPKIAYAVESIASVANWHRADGSPISGQLVYANRAKDFFPMMKSAIEEQAGFERGVTWEKRDNDDKIVGRYVLDEVELMTGDVPRLKRERIKEAFNAGVVKVIIGTSTIREGVDLQTKGTVIYNLAPDWNPTDVRQLEGRIHRQGNEYGYVRVVMPLVQDTMDVFVFQKLEEKSSRINDLWSRAGRDNVLDVESLDPQEIKLALLTDISALAKLLLDGERLENERKLRGTKEDVSVMATVRMHLSVRDNAKQQITDLIEKMVTDGALAEAEALYNRSKGAPSYDYAARDKEAKAKRLVEILTALIDWFQTAGRDTKDLLALKRFFNSDWYSKVPSLYPPAAPRGFSRSSSRYRYSSYSAPAPEPTTYAYTTLAQIPQHMQKLADSFRACAKAERSVLKPLRLTLADDLAPAAEQLDAEVKRLEALVDYYKPGGKRYDELKDEVAERKRTLAVVGRPPSERVAEFAKLNYLLSYRYSRDHQGCALPDQPATGTRSFRKAQAAAHQAPEPNKALQLKIKIAQARAKALLLLAD